jgi:hypothetical protein
MTGAHVPALTSPGRQAAALVRRQRLYCDMKIMGVRSLDGKDDGLPAGQHLRVSMAEFPLCRVERGRSSRRAARRRDLPKAVVRTSKENDVTGRPISANNPDVRGRRANRLRDSASNRHLLERLPIDTCQPLAIRREGRIYATSCQRNRHGQIEWSHEQLGLCRVSDMRTVRRKRKLEEPRLDGRRHRECQPHD